MAFRYKNLKLKKKRKKVIGKTTLLPLKAIIVLLQTKSQAIDTACVIDRLIGSLHLALTATT